MFTTLNLRWVIDLKEREKHSRQSANNNPQQPQKWFKALLDWCKHPTQLPAL